MKTFGIDMHGWKSAPDNLTAAALAANPDCSHITVESLLRKRTDVDMPNKKPFARYEKLCDLPGPYELFVIWRDENETRKQSG